VLDVAGAEEVVVVVVVVDLVGAWETSSKWVIIGLGHLALHSALHPF